MRMNESNQNGFDDMLKASLQKYSINVPEDFALRLLTRMQRQEYAAALCAIKRKERLLVAAMIFVPVAAVLTLWLMPPQIMAQINGLMASGRQMILFNAAKADFVLRHWIEIAIVMVSLIYILFNQVLA
jgi:hypothetical protein